ncbi:hypothetical protein AB0B66_10490 [Catellatospora sp. NPDC049111]|uniref:hypothetical protein n=1 Tax=Catellatospora sp. NPDC049111 TaxID=3155271 RepID=UPI0033C03290
MITLSCTYPDEVLRIRAANLPPHLLVPLIADFRAQTVTAPPDWMQEFLNHLAVYRLLAGFDVVPDASWPWVNDVAVYRYEVTFDVDRGGLLLAIDDRSGTVPIRVEFTHADIDRYAAVLCDEMAERAERFAASHDGFTFPDGHPSRWALAAARHRRRDGHVSALAAQANLAAAMLPASFDSMSPTLVIAGIHVICSLRPDGRLQVRVDTETADEWLVDVNGCTTMTLLVNETEVFDSDLDDDPEGLRGCCRSRTAPRITWPSAAMYPLRRGAHALRRRIWRLIDRRTGHTQQQQRKRP